MINIKENGGGPIIDTDTVHNAILFIQIATMHETRQLIR